MDYHRDDCEVFEGQGRSVPCSCGLDEALADERRATVERIAAQVDEYVAAFPSRNRTVLYGAALALRERLGQMAEQDTILDEEVASR